MATQQDKSIRFAQLHAQPECFLIPNPWDTGSARLLEHLPLIDNVALPLRVSGVAPDLRAADLEALLEWVDLAGRAEEPPAALTAATRAGTDTLVICGSTTG